MARFMRGSGSRVWRELMSLGVTQDDAADILGKSARTIRRRIRRDELLKVIEHLRISNPGEVNRILQIRDPGDCAKPDEITRLLGSTNNLGLSGFADVFNCADCPDSRIGAVMTDPMLIEQFETLYAATQVRMIKDDIFIADVWPMLWLARGIFEALRFAHNVTGNLRRSYIRIGNEILFRVRSIDWLKSERVHMTQEERGDVVRFMRECLVRNKALASRERLPDGSDVSLDLDIPDSWSRVPNWTNTSLNEALTDSYVLGMKGDLDRVDRKLYAARKRFEVSTFHDLNAVFALHRECTFDSIKQLDFDARTGFLSNLRMQMGTLWSRIILDRGIVQRRSEAERAFRRTVREFKASPQVWPHGEANFTITRAIRHYGRGEKKLCYDTLLVARRQFENTHDFHRVFQLKGITEKMCESDYYLEPREILHLQFDE